MAKVSTYPELGALGDDDRLYVVDRPAGTSAQITGEILRSSVYKNLWHPPDFDTICAPFLMPMGVATLTMTSGTPYFVGGPGMVVPAGETVRGIEFISVGAAASPTNQWFFLAMPDEATAGVTVILATSKNDLTTAWGTNTKKKLSLLVADGGSGEWTATVDTPVYAGIVQTATTPATLRGITSSGFACSMTQPRWFGVGVGGLTTPALFAGSPTIGDIGLFPLCRLSKTAS